MSPDTFDYILTVIDEDMRKECNFRKKICPGERPANTAHQLWSVRRENSPTSQYPLTAVTTEISDRSHTAMHGSSDVRHLFAHTLLIQVKCVCVLSLAAVQRNTLRRVDTQFSLQD